MADVDYLVWLLSNGAFPYTCRSALVARHNVGEWGVVREGGEW